MSYNYKQEPDWLLSDIGLNRVKIHENEYATLNTPSEFDYPSRIVTLLKKEYDPRAEKGGLVYFALRLVKGKIKYVAVDVAFVKNVSENKKTTYIPDEVELNKAYKIALSKKHLPFFFHTHPTIYHDGSIVMQGWNFLQQLNTSIQDQGMTLWCFKYNGVDVRFPQLLVLANANALFIGMYGGLIAPICFTEEKSKAMKEGLDKTFNIIGDWADTPGKQAVLAMSATTLVVSAFAFPEVVLPVAMAIGTEAPPLIYSNRKKHKYFGVTYFSDLKIHIPKLSDAKAIEYEAKALAAQKEARRIAEEAEKWKKAS